MRREHITPFFKLGQKYIARSCSDHTAPRLLQLKGPQKKHNMVSPDADKDYL